MTGLNLLYTDIETDLRASLRRLLADRCPPSAVAAVYEGARSLATAVWKSLSHEMGLAGLLVPADRGGAGASAREAAVTLEELGRAVAPVPFLTSSVIATVTLLAAEAGSAADELLAALACGEAVAALAVPLTATEGDAQALSSDAAGRVSGQVRSVAGALGADAVLVLADTPEGQSVVRVDSGDIDTTPVTSLDMTRQLADLTFVSAPGTTVVPGGHGRAAVDSALRAGTALLASEQLGIAQWCLETSVGYVKERRQFGRPIGSFQALKHRLADLFVLVETAAGTARYAAAVLAEGDADLPVATSVGQACCGDAAVRAAEEAIQFHGGMGMTWEHPLHLYLKRAKADQAALGGSAYHRSRIAELADLPGTASLTSSGTGTADTLTVCGRRIGSNWTVTGGHGPVLAKLPLNFRECQPTQ
jgi:alkylation response protein AidB-like acyl-CoA dehydrogenase